VWKEAPVTCRVYLAAASADIDRARHFMQTLRCAGIKVTSTWVESIDEHGIVNGGPNDITLHAAKTCLAEIVEADVLILLVPPPGHGYGSGVELGFALGSEKETILVGDPDAMGRSVFFSLGLADHWVIDEAAAVRLLKDELRALR
jgi:nucleoside 2-deoxyribosyltransferase